MCVCPPKNESPQRPITSFFLTFCFLIHKLQPLHGNTWLHHSMSNLKVVTLSQMNHRTMEGGFFRVLIFISCWYPPTKRNFLASGLTQPLPPATTNRVKSLDKILDFNFSTLNSFWLWTWIWNWIWIFLVFPWSFRFLFFSYCFLNFFSIFSLDSCKK